ncbi:DHHC palmitoyltransferase-domain-containing protein [Infundibulicybe gibba]|nr:DHHC palmitoyltransferase-domain-containing protein [Infundibulicybe gibba]
MHSARERTCCGVIEEAKYKSREKRSKKSTPQPWIVRKLMVFLTIGIMGYTAYVYIGRFCVGMIRRTRGAPAGRGTGIALLVPFALLYIWMLWAYAKVTLTAPGFAKDTMLPRHSDPREQQHTRGVNVGVLDTLPHPVTALAKRTPGPRVPRRPSMTPVLLPEYRYCSRDGIVKPFRAHHCRNCGTCVLKFDHHCPWIGQCVGARNHKFFVNFVQVTSILTLYIFATLLAYTIRESSDVLAGDVDPQQIVLIALAGVFALFTTTLLLSHTYMIWHGQTTVESMQQHNVKEREARALNREFRFWEFGAKRRTRVEWEREWGVLGTDGNVWWLGSGRKGWEDVMGTSVWGWFLPIGRSMNDGLNYPINPRFDQQGRWRRRAEWPAELR